MKYLIISLLISICVLGQSNALPGYETAQNTNPRNTEITVSKTIIIAGGTARIIDGLCEIAVEDLPEEYFVQITPLGETAGLFVFNKTAKSFSVKEIGHGKSNIEFDYIVFANVRRDSMRRDDMIDRAETVGGDRQPVSTATSSSGDSDN